MNADQAKFLADHYATLLEREMSATASVLEAVNSGNRDYKPDPKSRSAWDIAVHIAQADNWLIQSALAGKFEYDAAAAKQQAASFKDAAQLAALFPQEGPPTPHPAGAARCLLPQGAARNAAAGSRRVSRRAHAQRRFLRGHPGAGAEHDRVRARSQPASPWTAGGLPAGHGLEGTEHLRAERRRTARSHVVVVSRSPPFHRPPPPRQRYRHGGGAGRSPPRSRRNPSTRDRRGRPRADVHECPAKAGLHRGSSAGLHRRSSAGRHRRAL